MKSRKIYYLSICNYCFDIFQAGLVFSRACSDIGSLHDDPPQLVPMIRLLSPIGGKSNELNSSHNTLYFVDCPQSRGKVLCLLSIELLSGMGSRLHRCQLSVLGD